MATPEETANAEWNKDADFSYVGDRGDSTDEFGTPKGAIAYRASGTQQHGLLEQFDPTTGKTGAPPEPAAPPPPPKVTTAAPPKVEGSLPNIETGRAHAPAGAISRARNAASGAGSAPYRPTTTFNPQTYQPAGPIGDIISGIIGKAYRNAPAPSYTQVTPEIGKVGPQAGDMAGEAYREQISMQSSIPRIPPTREQIDTQLAAGTGPTFAQRPVPIGGTTASIIPGQEQGVIDAVKAKYSGDGAIDIPESQAASIPLNAPLYEGTSALNRNMVITPDGRRVFGTPSGTEKENQYITPGMEALGVKGDPGIVSIELQKKLRESGIAYDSPEWRAAMRTPDVTTAKTANNESVMNPDGTINRERLMSLPTSKQTEADVAEEYSNFRKASGADLKESRMVRKIGSRNTPTEESFNRFAASDAGLGNLWGNERAARTLPETERFKGEVQKDITDREQSGQNTRLTVSGRQALQQISAKYAGEGGLQLAEQRFKELEAMKDRKSAMELEEFRQLQAALRQTEQIKATDVISQRETAAGERNNTRSSTAVVRSSENRTTSRGVERSLPALYEEAKNKAIYDTYTGKEKPGATFMTYPEWKAKWGYTEGSDEQAQEPELKTDAERLQYYQTTGNLPRGYVIRYRPDGKKVMARLNQ